MRSARRIPSASAARHPEAYTFTRKAVGGPYAIPWDFWDSYMCKRGHCPTSVSPSNDRPDIPEVANPSVGDKEGGSEGLDDRLATRIEPIAQHENVTVETTSEAILIEFSGTLLYDTGSAVLRKKALPVIDEVTDSLLEIKDADYNVTVEGHTDDVPIGLSVFPSNWELSSARATSIVRRMLDKGVTKGSVSASAFADTRPLVPNVDAQGKGIPENRAKNRRIVVRIHRGN